MVRIWIAATFGLRGGDARGREYRAEFVGFLQKIASRSVGRNLSFGEYLEPEGRFIGLFQRAVDF